MMCELISINRAYDNLPQTFRLFSMRKTGFHRLNNNINENVKYGQIKYHYEKQLHVEKKKVIPEQNLYCRHSSNNDTIVHTQ